MKSWILLACWMGGLRPSLCTLAPNRSLPRVYLLELPDELNFGLVREAFHVNFNGSVSNPVSDMKNIVEYNLGQPFPSDSPGCHFTHQFNLEMILHQRLLNSAQRVADPWDADIIWIPYYASFGAFFAIPVGIAEEKRARLVWQHEQRFLEWLETKAPRYHTDRSKFVMAVSTVSHQFLVPPGSGWGSNLLASPRLRGINVVSIESRPGCSKVCLGQEMSKCVDRCHGVDGRISGLATTRIIGVPYPTFYHRPPLFAESFVPWSKYGSERQCSYLASFIGAISHSGSFTMGIRVGLIQQCRARPDLCLIEEASGEPGDIQRIVSVYQSSLFCLQPPGDTATRRGIFDSILSGCIPVVFSPDQLGGIQGYELQYEFHLPKPYELALLVPPNYHSSILDFLDMVSRDRERISRYQQEIRNAAGSLQYAHPKSVCMSNGCLDALDMLLGNLVTEQLKEVGG